MAGNWAEKQMDLSCFKRGQTGLPKEHIRRFFEVPELTQGQVHTVTIRYGGREYDARIRIMANGGARLEWTGELQREIRERFPVIHRAFARGNDPGNTPVMIFEKVNHLYFEVSFRKPYHYDYDKSELRDNLQIREEAYTKEGKVIYVQHRRRERNSRIIKQAIERAQDLYGTLACEICTFDFAKRYGKEGEGYIEGHHKRALKSYDEEGEDTHVDDIALVCSNCHRIIHRRMPWKTVEEMKAIVNGLSS